MRLSKLIGPDLKEVLRDDPEQARALLQEIHAEDLADIVAELEPDEAAKLLSHLPADEAAPIFERLDEHEQEELVEIMAPESVAHIASEMAPDDRADLFSALPDDVGTKLLATLERVDPEAAQEVREIEKWPETSAGHLMTTAFVQVPPDGSVHAAIEAVRSFSEEHHSPVYNVYVVGKGERLLGMASMRDLLLAKPDVALSTVTHDDVLSVTPDLDQEEVARRMAKYDLNVMPVIDKDGALLGVITIDDIVDVIREEATEDILKMAGAGEELFETRSFWSSFRVRMPWLFAAAVGGVLVAVALSGFEGALQAVPVLALFMPVIAGMGGNVGTQSSTIVVRGLAVGYVEANALGRLVAREMALGLSLGALYGVLIALVAPFVGTDVGDPLGLGVVLTLGMMGSMGIAATVGTSIPLLMHSLKIDPAVSTGPFVTTAVDILGLMFYFWLATVVLGVSL